jgi:hypothetical protein
MAETKVTADIAGRVCAVSAQAGGRIGNGDDIVLIEAMKMEIPVPSPSSRVSSAWMIWWPKVRSSRLSRAEFSQSSRLSFRRAGPCQRSSEPGIHNPCG